jgi:hypothetical protein
MRGLFESRVPAPGRTMADYLYCEPPKVSLETLAVLEVMQYANGLNPFADLEPTLWADTRASLGILVANAEL